MEDRSGSEGLIVVSVDAAVLPASAAVITASAVSSAVASGALTESEAVAAAAPHPESSMDATSRELII